MTELRDRYIRFDWAIKSLLRQKANFGVLEGFLTVFLNEPIKIVDILEALKHPKVRLLAKQTLDSPVKTYVSIS